MHLQSINCFVASMLVFKDLHIYILELPLFFVDIPQSPNSVYGGHILHCFTLFTEKLPQELRKTLTQRHKWTSWKFWGMEKQPTHRDCKKPLKRLPLTNQDLTKDFLSTGHMDFRNGQRNLCGESRLPRTIRYRFRNNWMGILPSFRWLTYSYAESFAAKRYFLFQLSDNPFCSKGQLIPKIFKLEQACKRKPKSTALEKKRQAKNFGLGRCKPPMPTKKWQLVHSITI